MDETSDPQLACKKVFALEDFASDNHERLTRSPLPTIRRCAVPTGWTGAWSICMSSMRYHARRLRG